MSNNGTPPRDSTRFVALFQKAHGHIAALRRLDDQIAALFEHRRKSLDELRAVQAQINNEFDRVLELERIIPADMLSNSDAKSQPREVKPAPELRMSRLETAMS